MLPRSRVCFFLFFPSISQQQVPVNHILFVFIRGGFRLFPLIVKTFFHPISDIFLEQKTLPIAGVLYGVKYWLSKSTSKMCQKFSVIITNICGFFCLQDKTWIKMPKWSNVFNIVRSVCFDYCEFLTNFLTYFLTTLFDAVQNSSWWHHSKLLCIWYFWFEELAIIKLIKLTQYHHV